MGNSKIDGVLMCGMKCASTWISKILNTHKDIRVIAGQSVKTTSDGIDLICCGHSVKTIQLIRRNLKDERFYVQSYKKHNPNMKFISLLRNPVARCFSHYRHSILKSLFLGLDNFESHGGGLLSVIYDFNKAINKELKQNMTPAYIKKSLYYSCLFPYFETFPKPNFLIFPFEIAVNDPSKILIRVSKLFNLPCEYSGKCNVVVNQDSFKNSGLFRKKAIFVPPTKSTKQILTKLFKPEADSLSSYVGFDFTRFWGLDQDEQH